LGTKHPRRTCICTDSWIIQVLLNPASPGMGRPSSGDFRDQGRIVTPAGPVHPPRYRHMRGRSLAAGRSNSGPAEAMSAPDERRHASAGEGAGSRPAIRPGARLLTSELTTSPGLSVRAGRCIGSCGHTSSRVISRPPAAKGPDAHPFAIRAGGCYSRPLGDQTCAQCGS
jgi:hypothetical protein